MYDSDEWVFDFVWMFVFIFLFTSWDVCIFDYLLQNELYYKSCNRLKHLLKVAEKKNYHDLRYQRCEVARHEHSVPCRQALWGDNSRR